MTGIEIEMRPGIYALIWGWGNISRRISMHGIMNLGNQFCPIFSIKIIRGKPSLRTSLILLRLTM